MSAALARAAPSITQISAKTVQIAITAERSKTRAVPLPIIRKREH